MHAYMFIIIITRLNLIKPNTARTKLNAKHFHNVVFVIVFFFASYAPLIVIVPNTNIIITICSNELDKTLNNVPIPYT